MYRIQNEKKNENVKKGENKKNENVNKSGNEKKDEKQIENEKQGENEQNMESLDSQDKTSLVCSKCDDKFESRSLLLAHINFHQMYAIQNEKKNENEKKCENEKEVENEKRKKSENEKNNANEKKGKNEQKKSIPCTDISCDETFYEQTDLQNHTISAHKTIKTTPYL